MKKRLIIFFFLFATAISCREAYVSPVDAPALGYLVVEGFINSAGPTSFTLSRVNQFSVSEPTYVKGALVQVEGTDNIIYKLVEKDKGLYTSDSIHLNTTQQYRLRIKTSDNKEYLSDFGTAKQTPPIDSISWKRENEGVQIYINTHDDRNATKYYRWEFVQTWEIHTTYWPDVKLDQRTMAGTVLYSVSYIFPLTQEQDTSKYRCWVNRSSTNILLGSSAKLSKDVIHQPLHFITPGARELSVLYSILVRQYAVTSEAYAFYEKMKKNTELTGSIFDAQPSQLVGNIKCISHPGEPVVGYISVSTMEEKRIFIYNSEVPAWPYKSGCFTMLVENLSDSIKKKAIDSSLVPALKADVASNGNILTFLAAPADCIDCTLTGKKDRPVFWP